MSFPTVLMRTGASSAPTWYCSNHILRAETDAGPQSTSDTISATLYIRVKLRACLDVDFMALLTCGTLPPPGAPELFLRQLARVDRHLEWRLLGERELELGVTGIGSNR